MDPGRPPPQPPRQPTQGSNTLVLKNLQAFLTCKRSNPNYASATAAAAGTLLSLSLINKHSGSSNSNGSGSGTSAGAGASSLTTGAGARGHGQWTMISSSGPESSPAQIRPLNLESRGGGAGMETPQTQRDTTPVSLLISGNNANVNANGSSNRRQLQLQAEVSVSQTSGHAWRETSAPARKKSPLRAPTRHSVEQPTDLSTSTSSASDDSKRNRSANYSAFEKEIFLSTVSPFKHLLEDKRFDSETLQEKAGAWRNIVSIYNSQAGVVKRDRKQLKELYKRLKDRARRSGGGSGSGYFSNGDVMPQPPVGTSTPTTTEQMQMLAEAAEANASSSKLMKLAMLANAATVTASVDASANAGECAILPQPGHGPSNAAHQTSEAVWFPVGSYSNPNVHETVQQQQIVFHAAPAPEDECQEILPPPVKPAITANVISVWSGQQQQQGQLGPCPGPVVKKITSTRLPPPPSLFTHAYAHAHPYAAIRLGTRPEGGDSGASAGGGRGQSRELTPEGEDMKHVIPTPSPLKEHMLQSLGLTPNQPSSQTPVPHPPILGLHPTVLPQASGSLVGGLGSLVGRPSGGLHNNVNHNASASSNAPSSNNGGSNANFSGGPSSGNSSASSPPPRPSSSSTQSNPITLKESPPQQMLCVRWGNFDSNIISMFSKLKTQESFVDVTLWCEGKTVKCHKIILSACSTYFETLLTETPNSHPIIFLKDMKFWEIQALVEFMYKGEVSIHQEKLQSLLRAAESLQIKGLGSPSNERNGFGTHNGAIGDDQLLSSVSGDGEENVGPKPAFRHSATLQAHRQPSRALFNSSALNSNNNNSGSNHSLLKNSQYSNHSMGIDLSNHAGAGGKSNNSSPPLSSAGYEYQGQHGALPAKRRKKETPRKIGNTSIVPSTITRAGLPQIPIQYALQAGNSLTPLQLAQIAQQQQEYDDDGGSINDSMDEDDGQHVEIKSDRHHQTDVHNEDSNDGGDQDGNYNENDHGGQSNDEFSDQDDGDDEPGFVINEDAMDTQAGGGGGDDDDGDPGDGDADGEEDDDNALDLGTNTTADQRERERSRKGNPIKKVHLGNNNNNYNDEDESAPPIQAALIQMATD